MIEHVLRLKPFSSSPSGRVALAGNLFDGGRLHLALAMVDRAVGENPELAEAHYLKGAISAQLERFEEAKASFELALRLYPDYADARAALARMCLEREEWHEALRHVDRLIGSTETRDPDARGRDFWIRARALRALGRADEAAAACRAALEQDPESVAAHSEIGDLLLQSNDVSGAIRHLEIAQKLHPAHAAAPLMLGDCWRRLGDTERALERYKAAVRLNPLDSRPHLRLAEIHLEENRLDQALTALRLASVVDPSNAACLLSMARVYRMQNRHREAVDFGRRALRIQPSLEAAERIVRESEAALLE